MFNNLTALGYGLVVFAIIIGVGSVVLVNFGNSSACVSGWTYNVTGETCYQTTNHSNVGNPTASWTNTDYLTGQLGQSGLAGWTPAIIAISVGVMFLGAFMVKGGRRK